MMLIEMRNTPIGGCLRAKEAETAGADCTLQTNIRTTQIDVKRIAANDIQYSRAA